MKFPLLSLFKTKKESLFVPDSLLLKKIKSLSKESNLIVLSDKEIFHHKERYPIPLIIYDDLRGLYIFEIKKWSYDDLKNATANKAKSVENSKNTLAFDKTHKIIKQKFNEILHNDGVEIFNYLLMENLSSNEYEHLNDSLQEMLPKEKIIFNNSDTAEIFTKLANAAQKNNTLPSADKILSTLFVQYAIARQDNRVFLCNNRQIEFIDKKIETLDYLKGVPKSGKSYSLLLKSIKLLFKKEIKKIVLIKPNMLSKNILHKHFLELIEHAIIDIDLMAFEIMTPLELINKHRTKLKMSPIENIEIDQKLLKKPFDAAELIICDDANLLPDNFLSYLKNIQKKSHLLFVNKKDEETEILFEKSYLPKKREISFYQTNPYAKTLHLVSSLLQKVNPDEIVVISNETNRKKLQEDLTPFIENCVLLLDGSKHLTKQRVDSVLLATYYDIIEVEANHLILMDLSFDNKEIIEYACTIAKKSLTILYEEESKEIIKLKEQLC